jgi:cysteine desulfurase/selenocysteine lyase
VISFLVDGINPEGLGKFLDEEGIAVRVGHHCAMPVMRRMNVPGTIRASLAFYNTFEEIDSLVDTIRKAKQTIAKGQGLVTETF